MLAGNQMILAIVREIAGAEPFGDYPVNARRPTGGQLKKDAGIDDITASPRGRPRSTRYAAQAARARKCRISEPESAEQIAPAFRVFWEKYAVEPCVSRHGFH
jgi:hypothetical protein